MPCDYSKYPPSWKAVRASILDRSGNRCERCGLLNGAIIRRCGDAFVAGGMLYRAHDGSRIKAVTSEITDAAFSREVKIVLTIAHIDHDTTNNDPSNLLALCQWHHLLLDHELHMRNAAETRRRKREEAGQMRLGGVG